MALANIFQPLAPYQAPRQLFSSLAEQPIQAPASSVQNGVDFNTFGQAPGEAGTRGPFTPPGASNPGDPFGPLPQTDADLKNPTQPGAGQPGAGGNAGAGGGAGYWSLDSDPVLAQIKALNARQLAAARASAGAARKQEQIGYGYDQNLSYEDDATKEAARQNAFSTLAQLLFNHGERAHGLDEALNKSNLFYSGERGRQIGLEGRQYTLEQSTAGQQHQQRMDAIAQMVLNAELQAQEREIQGSNEAYNRQLQFALANGTGIAGLLAGGGGGGGGVDMNDFLQHGNNSGISGQDIYNLAAQNAPTYNGVQFTPHAVMKEGDVFTDQNGRRYIEVKYSAPGQGSSTERVYLP